MEDNREIRAGGRRPKSQARDILPTFVQRRGRNQDLAEERGQ